MVNKNVLRKLSNQELERYLKEGNRFVPEAVQAAFEILEERGRIFNEQEKTAVQQLIQRKQEAEEVKFTEERELWKDHITEDTNAVKLFPRDLILLAGGLLGTIPGALLLGLNFIKLKKYGAAILTFVFGIVFLPIQNFLVPLIYKESIQGFFTYRKSPEFSMAAVGALILLVLWVLFTPKKLPYKAASYILPGIICLIMLAIIINYPEWFSGYLLVSFAK
ncbi:hypothetical protein A1704_04425 [Chryseobacterium cucumeris]|uniref:hypothetical protein n=1 Tax=Chryseobacterium TaxID=59732 RepID=UPI0007869DDA|nr:MULTISPECIES: hypothetical protein [Chryseobacterium]KYH07918.1 hypothetical protein A1704_04425 [Chryseobacterium cucumeris]WNI36874.1 hypothetical protein RHP76_00075 [Chryseobacterium sp. SG20098]